MVDTITGRYGQKYATTQHAKDTFRSEWVATTKSTDVRSALDENATDINEREQRRSDSSETKHEISAQDTRGREKTL